MAEARRLTSALARYVLVGMINSAVGLAIILGLQFGLGLAPHAANAVGYGAGICVGFILNRRFVFARSGPVHRAAMRYVAAAIAAFLGNQLTLLVAIRLLGRGGPAATASQAAAVACYSALMFLLCRFWVFAAAPTAASRTGKPRQANSNVNSG
jgi:putative flippase GtrA